MCGLLQYCPPAMTRTRHLRGRSKKLHRTQYCKTILQNKFLPDSILLPTAWLTLLIDYCCQRHCQSAVVGDATQSTSRTAAPVEQFLGLRGRTTEGCHQQVLLSTSTQCPEHNSFSTFHFTARIVHQSPKPHSLKHYHAKHCFTV